MSPARFCSSKTKRAKAGGWTGIGTHANGECLPFKDNSVDLIVDNENMADMTPVKLTRKELTEGRGETPQHQEALDWIRRLRLPLEKELPEEVIFNLGPMRFVAEVWRVLKPGGRAFLTEFGIEEGWPAAVKLPRHTEYEVQYSHLRQAVRWLGFQERYLSLPQFLQIKPDTKVLCTGAAYTIQRFCEGLGKSFAVRAYTERRTHQDLGRHASQTPGLPLPRRCRPGLVRPHRLQSAAPGKTRRHSAGDLHGTTGLSLVFAAVGDALRRSTLIFEHEGTT